MKAGRFAFLTIPRPLVEERISAGWAYRYLPLPGSRSALAVKMSQQMEKVLAGSFETRSSLRFSMRSGVLELLAFLGFQLPVDEETPGEGRVLILAFPRFTVMAVIRSDTGLASLATLPHGARSAPADAGFRVAAGLKQASIGSGTVWIVQASAGAKWEELRNDIDHYLSADVRFSESIRLMELPLGFLEGAVRQWLGREAGGLRPEMILDELSVAPRPVFGHAEASESLRNLAETNFSTAALRVAEQRVSRREAFWLFGSQCFQVAAVLILILGGGFFAFSFWEGVKSEAWNLPAEVFADAREKASNLESIHAAYLAGSGLLLPRSQAWSVLEGIARIFPDDVGTRLKSIHYEVQPMREAGARTEDGNDSNPRGFIRIWKLSGMANEAGEGFLDRLGKDRVSTEFAAVSELSGAEIFQPDEREVLPVVDRQPQQGVEADDGTIYGTRFSVVVEQRIKDGDHFAFPRRALRIPPEKIVRDFLP